MLELASIIILGILAQWVAWKFKIPAILPLILIGLLIGPISTMFSADGEKWIEPVWNATTGRGFFPGENLFYFVSLAISIILFEGGLTLRKNEVRNVGPVITKLITVGTLITFFASGALAHYIFELSWKISFLFGALVIVTGPTVISPILRNIPLKKDVSAVLKWEGILIDPIGALAAVLVFEFITVGEGNAFTKTALIEFGKIVLFGTTFGFTFAHALIYMIKRDWIPHYLLNVVSLSVVLLVFVESDIFAHESGLLAVVVMGLVMGNANLPNIKELLYFKESLSVLLISILFILLAANIDIQDLLRVYNWNSAILFACIVFLVRPLGVFLSTIGSNLKLNEKLFISWVGPRGIVAAGIASLFGTKLAQNGEPGAEYITPLVFMIVLGTVLLNATTARPFARLVGVFLKTSKGILIVGANNFSRLIAKYLADNDRHVVLVDTNRENVNEAQEMGLQAVEANIFSEDLTTNIEFSDMGYLMALTASKEVNNYALNRFAPSLGENGAFRLITHEEINTEEAEDPNILFSTSDDFINLSEVARDFPVINELEVTSKEHFTETIDTIKSSKERIPIFLKSQDGVINILTKDLEVNGVAAGDLLVYLGKPLKFNVG